MTILQQLGISICKEPFEETFNYQNDQTFVILTLPWSDINHNLILEPVLHSANVKHELKFQTTHETFKNSLGFNFPAKNEQRLLWTEIEPAWELKIPRAF